MRGLEIRAVWSKLMKLADCGTERVWGGHRWPRWWREGLYSCAGGGCAALSTPSPTPIFIPLSPLEYSPTLEHQVWAPQVGGVWYNTLLCTDHRLQARKQTPCQPLLPASREYVYVYSPNNHVQYITVAVAQHGLPFRPLVPHKH